ncbi:MAG: methyltransferase [Clostridiales bacterium]|jgi:tRNA1Val (adenine37-N6)-methyltransferase|nr:MAG: methyltransferase [Clostridiales bacterium]
MTGRETIEELGRYRLRQRSHLPKLGTDSNQLSQFATLHAREKVCDLGCGVGVLGLLLAQRRKGLTLDGIELVAESAALAAENLRENGLQGQVIHGDLRDCRRWFPTPGGYQLVVSNPPYFAPHTGKTADGVRAAARSEETCTVEDVCAAAGWLLRTGGRFALCYRSERLAALFAALQKSGLEPKRMQLIQHSAVHPPKVALVEAVRLGRPGLKVLPTLFVGAPPAERK